MFISKIMDTILNTIISFMLFIVNLFLNSGSKKTYKDIKTREYINLYWFYKNTIYNKKGIN